VSYTAPPSRYDHELIIGDTYIVVASLVDEDGEAYDITGATGTASIATEPGGTELAAPTVALVGAGTLGTFSWTLAAATTAALTAARAQYSVRLTFADASKHTILEGVVQIRRSVVL
jgi:threonine dehydrogenase-like Zn-dependent dehydrogenase